VDQFLGSRPGGSAHGTDFLAIPELSVVELPTDFRLEQFKDKSVKEQVQLVFTARRGENQRRQQQLADERKLLEKAFALPATGVGNDKKNAQRQDDAVALKKIVELEGRLDAFQKEVKDLRQQLQSREEADADKAESPVVWGKASYGLQAGLALRSAIKPLYRIGDTVQFVLRVRNVSNRPVEMRYNAVAPDARIGPLILDVKGTRPPLSGPAYNSVGGRGI
jgi:hypothetical protein